MVWAGVSSKSKAPFTLVPEGVKTKATSYEDLILELVAEHLNQALFNDGQFFFQQEGAPAHTTNRIQRWFRDNVPDFLPKKEWSPLRPDLNLIEFSI
ncbi:hypothetical protein FHG87_000079 [Trinorchestia longiramus]|nr:hypothetical protein FHG87_000079 [Trinorchestia longiramus]